MTKLKYKMNKTSKITVGVLGAVLISISLQAQNLNFGMQGGANFAVQSSIGDIYDNGDIKAGFSAGVFMNYALAKKMHLQLEMNYDQKGSATEETVNKYNYWSVPVVLGYELFKAPKSGLAMEYYLGPSVAFLMSAETEFDNSELENIDRSADTKDAEFGMQTGLRIKYPIHDQYIFANLKYGMGLTSFDKNDSDPKNKFWGISLGYEF